MHNRFFRYEEYETPLSGIVTGSKSGDVFGYTNDYILKKGAEEALRKVEVKRNVLIKRACYKSSWLYDCYDADNGDYYGWIKESDLTLEKDLKNLDDEKGVQYEKTITQLTQKKGSDFNDFYNTCIRKYRGVIRG